jgi:translation initiation factor IF-3
LIDAEGEQVGIVSLQDAKSKAAEASLDLVEISPNAEPPVCRIMDYGRFVFGKKKRVSENKKKQRQIQVKEIKFRPTTDIGDYNIKLRKINTFLDRGDKVKVSLRFRGREIQHKELGMQLLERVKADLPENIVVEQQPKLEGRQMSMIVNLVKN